METNKNKTNSRNSGRPIKPLKPKMGNMLYWLYLLIFLSLIFFWFNSDNPKTTREIQASRFDQILINKDYEKIIVVNKEFAEKLSHNMISVKLGLCF